MENDGDSASPKERVDDPSPSQEHRSLKYSLLGPSLLKAGQDAVDQRKVSISSILPMKILGQMLNGIDRSLK